MKLVGILAFGGISLRQVPLFRKLDKCKSQTFRESIKRKRQREREREREVEKMKRRRKRSWARRGGGEEKESSETTLALLHKHKLTNNTAGAGASVLCPSICLETGVLLVLCPAKLTIEVDSRPLPPLHNQNSP